MKYLIRGIYAFAIGMNVGVLGLMFWKGFQLSFWNQVVGQVVLIGVFIYWFIEFERSERRRAEINKAMNEALDDLHKHLIDLRDSMKRAKETPAPAKKRVQRKRAVAKKKVIVATGNNGTIK